MTAPGTCDVLIYVQHLLGIGHLRRAAVLARTLAAEGLGVDFVSGGLPVADLDLGAARLHQLPPLKVLDEDFGLVDAAGEPVDDAWKAARRDRLLDLYCELRPKAVMIELFPFGRRNMRFELLPLLEAVQADRPRVRLVSSLRDILTTHKQPEKAAWMLETFQRYFDCLIVHGDPDFVPLARSFPRAGEIAGQTRYSGYVVAERPASSLPRADDAGAVAGAVVGEVIVSTGGGAVAAPLVAAALGARALSPLAAAPWRILIGPNLPEPQFQAFRQAALSGPEPENLVVERARPDFMSLLAGARLSISQAGYNTVMELLQAAVPAVLVPFAAGSETEQGLRARLLAARGLVTVVAEADLSAHSLAAGVAAALAQAAGRPSGAAGLDCDGARKTAQILREIIATLPA